MYDKQTNSLWVNVTGRAEEGPLKGAQLELIPSIVTTWKDWRQRHPETLVLGGLKRGGFMGSYGAMEGRSDEIGLAVILRGNARLYPYQALHSQPLVNDRLDEVPILVVYNETTMTTYVWKRQFKDKVLTFSKLNEKDDEGRPLFIDRETGSHWSWITGRAISGPLKGLKLLQLPSHPILVERFAVFYPKEEIFAP